MVSWSRLQRRAMSSAKHWLRLKRITRMNCWNTSRIFLIRILTANKRAMSVVYSAYKHILSTVVIYIYIYYSSGNCPSVWTMAYMVSYHRLWFCSKQLIALRVPELDICLTLTVIGAPLQKICNYKQNIKYLEFFSLINCTHSYVCCQIYCRKTILFIYCSRDFDGCIIASGKQTRSETRNQSLLRI